MKIYTGIDLVHIPSLKRTLKRSGQVYLERIFLPEELIRTDPEHLAGIIATKEAVFKALSDQESLTWKQIRVVAPLNQKPQVSILLPLRNISLINLDVSISHEGDYAIAVAVALGN